MHVARCKLEGTPAHKNVKGTAKQNQVILVINSTILWVYIIYGSYCKQVAHESLLKHLLAGEFENVVFVWLLCFTNG
jgi:hypothetical protein